MKNTELEKVVYPDVLVKICGGLYSISSRYIVSITKMTKYNKIPGAPKNILGIMDFRGDAIPLLDMRTIFEMPALDEEYKKFTDMLEARKQDHIHWVQELERTFQADEKFTLATDPHKCAFGKWYDNFEPANALIGFHMKKIEEPHRKLHEAAMEVENCSKQHNTCKRERCVKLVFEDLKEDYMPTIINLLDEAKGIFKASFSEMLIVMKGKGRQIAITVDEVLSVENLVELNDTADSLVFQHSNYISGVKQLKGIDELILNLDDDILLSDADLISET